MLTGVTQADGLLRSAEVAFVGALVHRFPVLLPLLQEHLDDYDGLLPHVFLGDVTRWVLGHIESPADSEVGAVLVFFEACFAQGGEHERELISVSFLENLPRRGEPGAALRDQLGPDLLRQLDQIG